MRFLLHTNIISNATKPQPSAMLLSWLADQVDSDLFTSTLSLAEIPRGILEKSVGKKRRELEDWFGGPEGPGELFRGRILGFDERAAITWGRLMAERTRSGRPGSALDMRIASIAHVNDCILVTDNEKQFPGIKVFNPLRERRAEK
jgi:toxin FitB